MFTTSEKAPWEVWWVDGWDDATQEPVGGGVMMFASHSLGTASDLARSCATLAAAKHGPGKLVIVNERGERVMPLVEAVPPAGWASHDQHSRNWLSRRFAMAN